MKEDIANLVNDALPPYFKDHALQRGQDYKIVIENARNKTHGDYACNIALMLAKKLGLPPRELAEGLKETLEQNTLFSKVEIAGPGFINFFINKTVKSAVVSTILYQKDEFGDSLSGNGERVILEFVSANPTGPLHVGHGRGAAYGASLANVLKSQGFDVFCEYYVNDAGRQMNILAVSVLLRYLEALGNDLLFPANGYKGAYVNDIAKSLKEKVGETYLTSTQALFKGLPADEDDGGDKEVFIDALITQAKKCLGTEVFQDIHQYATQAVLKDIKDDLAAFGVTFDNWFSEKSLFDEGAINKGIEALRDKEMLYEHDNALWFKSTHLGDEKDRVLKRANGASTYFASDVAYHWNKYERNFTQLINIFGADHHGYVARVKAAAKSLGFDESAITILLVQFAILYRGAQRVQMSTRSGEFVTLRELREEVGADAARFFYVMRKPNQHMDFDLDLAKSQSNENPVYYIQYAHARICSVFRTLKEKAGQFNEECGLENLNVLTEEAEQALLNSLNRYSQTLALAARDKAPHQVAYYLRELATEFHSYYNNYPFILDDEILRNARLTLITAVKQVLKNGLCLLGVSAPEAM